MLLSRSYQQKNFLSSLFNSFSGCLGTTNYVIPVICVRKVILSSLCKPEMDPDILSPPASVRGMKVLDKEAFKKKIVVLSAQIEKKNFSKVQGVLKKYLLKIRGSVQDIEGHDAKKVLFNPSIVKNVSDFDESTQQKFNEIGLSSNRFSNCEVMLCYDHWTPHQMLSTILADDDCSLSSYSRIGHIIHLNLKACHEPYKLVIGQILLDRTKGVRTVVNKTGRIETKYRNFEMELIAGEPDYIVTVKENGTTFQMDFSTVYWNPRLSTEHNRIVDFLNENDVLFDVFCGVGPFAIPAAKKKCLVYANDLNPESFKWLNKNVELNNSKKGLRIETFNKDGADFISCDVKTKLIELWQQKEFNNQIMIVMNLPGLALEFLKSFQGLIKSEIKDLNVEFVRQHLPIIHCYFFALSSDKEKDRINGYIEEKSGIELKMLQNSQVEYIRNVSLSKDMYRLTFQLSLEFLTLSSSEQAVENNVSYEPVAKRVCKSD